MATDSSAGWRPDWAVAPGEILLETLHDRGMTQAELARRMARPTKTINEIVKGKAAITPETAIQLERTLGISARFWTGLELNYRETLARKVDQEDLDANAAWAEGFPVKDMARYQLIRGGLGGPGTLAEILSYLRIGSPRAFERYWAESVPAFRSSPAFMASPKAVAAWLRWGEIEAEKVAGSAAPYDAVRFREILDEIRPLTRREPFSSTLQKVKDLCLAAGVIVVLTPEFEGTRLSGATQWVDGRPVIQLSLRHRSDDHLWFTFIHESGHVLAPRHRRTFVDPEDLFAREEDPDELAANTFARDLLIPSIDYDRFVAVGDFNPAAVRQFAQEQRIAAGIVVGRLQHDAKIPRSHLNHLKKRLTWA